MTDNPWSCVSHCPLTVTTLPSTPLPPHLLTPPPLLPLSLLPELGTFGIFLFFRERERGGDRDRERKEGGRRRGFWNIQNQLSRKAQSPGRKRERERERRREGEGERGRGCCLQMLEKLSLADFQFASFLPAFLKNYHPYLKFSL